MLQEYVLTFPACFLKRKVNDLLTYLQKSHYIK